MPARTLSLRRRIGDWLAARLQRRGYALLPQWRLNRWPYSAHIRTLLQEYGIDTVLDVGANIGQYHEFLRLFVDYEGAIVSLEPVSELYARLAAASARDPLWQVHRLALGDVESSLPINVSRERTLSSLLPRNEPGLRQMGYQKYLRETEVDSVEEVPVRRLDTVIGELVPPAARIFLKCDTQGYDMNVVRGARQCLDRLIAVQVELSVRHVYEGSVPYLDALAELESLGFELTAVFPVQRDSCLRVINLDCVLVRRDECARLKASRPDPGN